MKEEVKLEQEVKETEPEDKPQEPDQKSTKKLPLIIPIIATALVVGAVLTYWFTRKPSSNSAGQTPQPTVLTEAVSITSPTGSGTPTKTPIATKSPTPSPTATPTPTLISTTLGSSTSLDGFRSSNNGGNNAADIRAGRNTYLNTRGFVSFNLPSTLNGKTINKAILRLYQAQTIGSPYGLLGSLKIDHLDYGSTLDNSSYSASSLSSSFATVTSNANTEWKDVDVTDMLRDDVTNNRTRNQYRIHFQTEGVGGDATGDFAYFESADNSIGTGNVPQLVISYY